jgi:hypothetical protein
VYGYFTMKDDGQIEVNYSNQKLKKLSI